MHVFYNSIHLLAHSNAIHDSISYSILVYDL